MGEELHARGAVGAGAPLPRLLLLAADDRAALLGKLDALLALSDAAIAEHASADGKGSHGGERLAILAPRAELRARVATARERLERLRRPRLVMRHLGIDFASGAERGRVAFVFPGQGSQHAGMLRELKASVGVVRDWFDALDRAAAAIGEPPPSRLIDSDIGDAAARRRALFDLETGAQLGTVADLAVFDVLTRLGIAPDVVVGHSNGEHAAILASGRAGALDRDALCRGFCELTRAGRRLPRRADQRMVAVSALDAVRRDALLARHAGEVFLAMDNCPHQQVLGGSREAVERVAAEVIAAGAVAGNLPFIHAFHTPLFADWQATLAEYYASLPLRDAGVPVYSCLTAAPIDGDPHACRRTMAAQWTSQVRFRETVQRLWDDGVRTFVECGPDNKLSAFVDDTLRGKPHLAVSALSAQHGDLAHLLQMLGELHTHGAEVDARRFEKLLLSPLSPTWQSVIDAQQKLIADARVMMDRRLRGGATSIRGATSLGDSTSVRFTRDTHPWVDDHALGRRSSITTPDVFPLPVLAFTTSLRIAADAAAKLGGRAARVLTDVRASRWLALDGGTLELSVDASSAGGAVQVRLGGNAFEATVGFEATSGAESEPSPGASRHSLSEGEEEAPKRWTAGDFYSRYAFHGPSFQCLRRVTAVGARSIEADLVAPAAPGALLDGAGQLVAFWLLEHERREPVFGIFPFAARRVVLHGAPLPPGTPVRCRGTIERPSPVMTEASFVFTTAAGEPVMSIEGLAQRLVELPAALARRIFSGEAAELSTHLALDIRSIDAADWPILDESFGIWERALAHLVLAPFERAAWLAMPRNEGRCRWLLARVVAKETVRRWAAARGIAIADAGVGISGDHRIVCAALQGAAPALDLRIQGTTITAAVAGIHDAARRRQITISGEL